MRTVRHGKVAGLPGEAERAVRVGSMTHGVRSEVGRESASSVMAGEKLNPIIGNVQRAHEEATYRGRSYAPLGKGSSAARGAGLPLPVRASIATGDAVFGITSDSSISAGDLLAPHGGDGRLLGENDQSAAELYKKSHRAYAPGEQVRSGVAMRGVGDPGTFRFGARAERSLHEGGVPRALAWVNDELGGEHTAVLVPAHMAGRTARYQPKIGVSRARALIQTGEIPDVSHGVVSRNDDIGAGELIHNSLPEELLAEDAGLGKPESYKGRPRGVPQEKLEATRVYGVPSIRSDVRPPGVRKLDDRQNYGDEKGAWELLNPSPYHPIGVTEDDFLTPLPKTELASVVAGAGISLGSADFDSIYAAAASLDPNGLVSIHSFRSVLDAFRARGLA